MTESYESLGFTSPTQGNYAGETYSAAYTVDSKVLDDGSTLVLVTVRGTKDAGEGIDEWLSNVSLGFQTKYGGAWHSGFYSASEDVYKAIKSELGGSVKTSNAKYFVTGHSRGAAVANILEVRLMGAGVPKSSVYGYNIACPDVATGGWSGWNEDDAYNNIFNLCNSRDPVPYLPGVVGDVIHNRNMLAVWGKFGISKWFTDEYPWSNVSCTTPDFAAHDQDRYRRFLREEPTGGFKSWWDLKAMQASFAAEQAARQVVHRITFGIFCPVDVEVVDASGNVIASVAGGVPDYHGNELGRVVIAVDGDEKAIAVPYDEGYEVRLSATGEGSMTLTSSTVELASDSVSYDAAFENVALEQGRELVAHAEKGAGPAGVRLYVAGADGKLVAEVAEDGSERGLGDGAKGGSGSSDGTGGAGNGGEGASGAGAGSHSGGNGGLGGDESGESDDNGGSAETGKADGVGDASGQGGAAGAGSAEGEPGRQMHRLYNQWSGEHFYTADDEEFAGLVALGWTDEGTGWTAPESSNTPVFRMYNPYAGEHHYTMKADEKDAMVDAGWVDEGIGWYSDDAQTVPLYREYNPFEFSNNHNYTTDKAEHDGLVAIGWLDEGYAWYGL